MLIHLKRNEKLYLNGAVIRLDRRGTVELLNDAQFLLENHVMQAEDATTPLKQIYFIIQMMLMDPGNAHLTNVLLQNQLAATIKIYPDESHATLVEAIKTCVEDRNYFEALKLLRQRFRVEQALIRSERNMEEAA